MSEPTTETPATDPVIALLDLAVLHMKMNVPPVFHGGIDNLVKMARRTGRYEERLSINAKLDEMGAPR